MSDNQINKPEEEDEAERLRQRFPTLPHLPHAPPAVPKVKVDLPPPTNKTKAGANDGGSLRSSALAYQAASSFIMPIILLGLLGWFLDGRLHKNGIITVIFFILGFVVGVASLLRIVNQMNDDPPTKKN